MPEFTSPWPYGGEQDEVLVHSQLPNRHWVAIAFAVAAALWAVAPFLRLYAAHLSNNHVAVDGWGRVSAAPDVLVQLQLNLPNYGVVFLVAAAVNAAAAALAARSRSVGRASMVSEFAVGAVAAGGGLGVAGMLAVDLSWLGHSFTHLEPGPAVIAVGIAIVASIIGAVSAWPHERIVTPDLSSPPSHRLL